MGNQERPFVTRLARAIRPMSVPRSTSRTSGSRAQRTIIRFTVVACLSYFLASTVIAQSVGDGSPLQFGDRVRLDRTVNTANVEISPDISPDGTELYYTECIRGRPPRCRVKLSERDDLSSPWQRAKYVNVENWTYMTAGVTVSADGLEMYFGDELWPEPWQFFPPESSGGDLWVSRRATIEDDWGAPMNLGQLVNSDSIDTYPHLSPDGLGLYFQSNRTDGYGGMDVWVARRSSTSDPFGPAENLGEVINSSRDEGTAGLSPDGSMLLFTSDRPGGFGQYDLWMSMRTSLTAPWAEPINLASKVNTPDFDSFPSVSADGRTIYFHSGFPNPSAGDGDIWQITIEQSKLEAGDADQDLDFDQFDLIRVQQAAKYLTGQGATWGEGDWNGAPGGKQGSPPAGNGLFDQLDIIAALSAGKYLTGPYAALSGPGTARDAQTSIIYDARTGELAVDTPAGRELTSINVGSATGIFTGNPAQNLGGSFDNDADNNIFKATFGSSFGSLSFGNVAQGGLSEQLVRSDLTVVGSLAGGGDLGQVDLIYVPEPTSAVLLAISLLTGLILFRRAIR